MASVLRSWLPSTDKKGYLQIISPSSSNTSPGRLPAHHASRSDPLFIPAVASSTSFLRSKLLTIVSLAGCLVLLVWGDRRWGRQQEDFAFVRWKDHYLDPAAGFQRGDYASLSAVCKASRSAIGNGGSKKIGTLDVGMDRMMGEETCNMVFPALYKEAERAEEYYKARGAIRESELDKAIDHGHARVLIHNNRMYIKQFNGGPGKRTEALLNSIQEAVVTSPDALPDIEFVVKTTDAPNEEDNGIPLWVLDRTEEQEHFWLVPDYGFYSWPEPMVGGIIEVRDKCGDWEARQTWSDKIPRLFWRGAILVKLREQLLDIVEGWSWSDVKAIDWGALKGMLKTPEEHCAYKYLAHAEGYAYSGRLKYLQMCRSVVVAHEMSFIQHFHHLIDSEPGSPTQNMVMAPGPGFEGLPHIMKELIGDDARAERIANNSFELFRHYLSPAAVNCYWRELFRSWSRVQGWEPKRQADYTSFESFNLMHQVHWAPH